MVPHVFSDLGPDGKQRALSLMVACPIGMGFAKITDDDRTIDCADDRAQRDLLGRPGEHVAPANTALRGHDARTLEGEKDLLEIWLGEAGAFGDVADRGWSRVSLSQGKREQSPARIVAAR